MDFSKIKVGDIVDAGPLISGLSPEVIVAMACKATPEAVEFDLSYYGVSIGKAKLDLSAKEQKWELT